MSAAADKALAEAIRAMEAAKPRSGIRPETEQEWRRVIAAVEQLAYAMQLMAGQSPEKARAYAHIAHSGVAGRILLEMAFDADEARHG